MESSQKGNGQPRQGNKQAKMPRLSNDEQFKFLISCIRYSNNGKVPVMRWERAINAQTLNKRQVDFTEVANECNIVSKGAAAKRYERMMKAHGIHQGRESYTASALRARDESAEPAAPAAGAGPSKKRKADGAAVAPTAKAPTDNSTSDSDPGPVKDEEDGPGASAPLDYGEAVKHEEGLPMAMGPLGPAAAPAPMPMPPGTAASPGYAPSSGYPFFDPHGGSSGGGGLEFTFPDLGPGNGFDDLGPMFASQSSSMGYFGSLTGPMGNGTQATEQGLPESAAFSPAIPGQEDRERPMMLND